ncbi:DegT/DnrJ/EryC1/StrS family aminotransferase, partial [Candidatus Microgenomates bacterium]|nr:DegT/DnrJ/EryC1/StrS family aminotransferase [Candidatus Microgenomates bacterium]
MKSKKEIRKEIRRLIKAFFSPDFSGDKFIPGETLVQYAGSVYDDKEIISMVDSLLDGWLGLGKKAREFEKELAKYIGMKKAVLTNSGSSASFLAMASLKSPLFPDRIKEGMEMITVACTFPTTLNPIIQFNLVPVFVDVELGTYNLNPDNLEAAFSSKTRAIV